MSIIGVSDSSDLLAALRAASAGDTFVLEGGNYGSLSLRDLRFASEVKITAAGAPVVFEALDLNRVANLTFEGVDLVVADSGSSRKPFLFNNTTNVTVRDAEIVGATTADGFGTSQGVWAINSTGFRLENNEIRNFNVAAHLRNLTDLGVEGNRFSNIAWDAMIVGGVHGAVFDDNDISLNVRKGTKHTDGIQFWNAGTNNPSSDVVVRGNTIVTNNTASHGIFGSNVLSWEVGGEGAFRNFVIEDNTVVGGQVAGIHIGRTDGLVIRGNTVLQAVGVDDSALIRTPTIRVDAASTGVVLTGNIVHRQPDSTNDNFTKRAPTPAGWTIASNEVVPLGTDWTSMKDRDPEETPGGGHGGSEADHVETSLAAYTAPAHAVSVTYTGTGAFAGTGNARDNVLTGGAGDDTLDGAAGADRMIGLGGDDAYVVDDKDDATVERPGGGVDTVLASVSFTLAVAIENGALAGSANLRMTGNDLANVIVGNGGDNVISGLGGPDVLSGGDGDDRLLGRSGTDTLDGGAGADDLHGNGGKDVLIGGAGDDRLDGGAGDDVFRFETGGFGHDTVTGFDPDPARGQDLIDLSDLGITGPSFASAVDISGDQDTRVVVQEAGSITLVGVHPSDISADDFILLA